MSFRARIISVFERLADRLDSIDEKLTKLDAISETVHDLHTRVLIVASDHDGELEQLNRRVRDLETTRRSNGTPDAE